MIVVEGFDGSGKSTLCKLLSAALKLPVETIGGPTKDVQDVIKCLDKSYAALSRDSIKDRTTYVSESVYSSLSDPAKAAMALTSINDISRITWRKRIVMVYCRPPTGFLINELALHEDKAHDPPGHMDRVRRQAPFLIDFYDVVVRMVARQRVRVIEYDRTKDKIEPVIEQLRGLFR